MRFRISFVSFRTSVYRLREYGNAGRIAGATRSYARVSFAYRATNFFEPTRSK